MLDLGLLAGIIRYMSSAYSRMTLRDDTGCRSEAVTTRGRPYNRTLDYMLVDILHATVIFQSGNVTGNCWLCLHNLGYQMLCICSALVPKCANVFKIWRCASALPLLHPHWVVRLANCCLFQQDHVRRSDYCYWSRAVSEVAVAENDVMKSVGPCPTVCTDNTGLHWPHLISLPVDVFHPAWCRIFWMTFLHQQDEVWRQSFLVWEWDEVIGFFLVAFGATFCGSIISDFPFSVQAQGRLVTDFLM